MYACPEASGTLKKNLFGYFVVGIGCGLFLLILVWQYMKRNNQELYKMIVEMQERNVSSVRDAMNYRTRQKKLQALKPKLQVIEKRLQQMAIDKETSTLSTDAADGKIRFDARKLFDTLGTDNSDDLDYEEINSVLKLKAVQLSEFIRRMNQAAEEPEKVSRPAFVKNFLHVLEVTSHFEPTPLEAGQLFDEIAAEQGTTNNGEVLHKDF